MKGILYSICVGSLALALTAQGEQVQGSTNVDAKAKARSTSKMQATTSAKTNASTSMQTRRNMDGTRFHRRANVSAQTSSSAAVDRNRMRNTSTSANTRIRPRNDATVNRQRERNIAMTERVKNQQNTNVRTKANVHVNVNDRTRFTNVTRITSSGRNFNRAVFRDRNDWHFRLGFHDRIFFINRFSEVILINGCSFFLDEGIFWPAFIIGESCVPAPNVVFVAVG